MQDPGRSSANGGVGGSSMEGGLSAGEWAGTGVADWGGRRGEIPSCSHPETEMLSHLMEDGAWLFGRAAGDLGYIGRECSMDQHQPSYCSRKAPAQYIGETSSANGKQVVTDHVPVSSKGYSCAYD